MPNAPRFPESHLLLHRTSFFTPLDVLVHNPIINIPENLGLLREYIGAYVSAPLVLVGVGCILLPIRQLTLARLLFASGCLLPLAVQMTLLGWFPSRYVFPHVWPCVLGVGAATAALLVLITPFPACISVVSNKPGNLLLVQSQSLRPQRCP